MRFEVFIEEARKEASKRQPKLSGAFPKDPWGQTVKVCVLSSKEKGTTYVAVTTLEKVFGISLREVFVALAASKKGLYPISIVPYKKARLMVEKFNAEVKGKHCGFILLIEEL